MMMIAGGMITSAIRLIRGSCAIITATSAITVRRSRPSAVTMRSSATRAAVALCDRRVPRSPMPAVSKKATSWRVIASNRRDCVLATMALPISPRTTSWP